MVCKKSNDWGETWSSVTTSAYTDFIFDLTFNQEGLLYVGTETGIYISRERLSTPITTSSNEEPKGIQLHKNYPNPFNPTTRINFRLPRVTDVELAVYDMLGRKVETLVDGKRQAGRHSVTFDASGLSSGMYIYRLKADGQGKSRKMLLVK